MSNATYQAHGRARSGWYRIGRVRPADCAAAFASGPTLALA